MASVKTAISLPKAQFSKANAVAREMKITRSRLFQLALDDYLARRRNEELLAQINAAYADGPTEEERALLNASMRAAARRLKDDKW